jgi:transposase
MPTNRRPRPVEERAALEARRLEAAELFAQGRSQAEVARELGVSRQSAHVWHAAWQQGGVDALRSRGPTGPDPKLSATQLARVEEALLAGAMANGFDTDLWTLERVAVVITQLTGVRYHLVKAWWQAQQEADGDPVEEAVILAWQRGEVDRLNSICQQIMADHGRLGIERLQVGHRQLAVGDRVVCGRNALAALGVANGTRGSVTALDPHTRTLTIRTDGSTAREVILQAWYLDGQNPRSRHFADHRRTVDLGYATTGHKAQGLTRWRALIRLTGREDTNWLYVQLSRAKHATTIYTQVGPEPSLSEVGDLPEQESSDGYQQLARAIGRDGGQVLALDTTARLDLRRLSVRELRAERDRLAQLLAQAPKDQTRALAHATQRRQDAERTLAAATFTREVAASRVGELSQLGGLGNRRKPVEVRQQHRLAWTAEQLARRQADRAAETELAVRRAQQQRAGWFDAHPEVAKEWHENARELAWRKRVGAAALELDRPTWQERALGPLPDSVRGRRLWRQTAAQLMAYRDRYGISDPAQAIGGEPRGVDLGQRKAWRACRQALQRVRSRSDRSREPSSPQPNAARTDQADPPQRGAERAAG